MSDSSSNSGNPQRWWEGYLVRYFLGFIVGIICVITIGIQTILSQEASFFASISAQTSNPNFRLSELGVTPLAIAFALLGIAYCYIASSPITVLHSTRMMKTWFHRYSRSFWMAWALTLTLHLVVPTLYEGYSGEASWKVIGHLIVLLLLAALMFFFSTLGPNDRIKGARLFYTVILGAAIILLALCITRSYLNIKTSLAAFALPVLWILFGQYWTLFALLKDDNQVFLSFYKEISRARQKRGSRDIRDSYTHLREHANSVFVVLIELCILAGLLTLRQAYSGFATVSSPLEIESTYWISILILTGIWLVPTVFMWSLANRLEKKFSDESDDFIHTPTPP